METLMEIPVPEKGRDSKLNWLPLPILTALAFAFSRDLPGWLVMWLMAFACFVGFKWWTWRRALDSGTHATVFRSLAFLFLWPGMAARKFLDPVPGDYYVTPGRWLWAVLKTCLGAAALWVVARHFGHGLVAGWVGMIGFVFLLHFGLFDQLSFFWQGRGINAPPLMNCPIAAHSLQNFWGRRWNAGFHDIVFSLFFLPLARRRGATIAALLTFLLSGLIHELVITVPAGVGYGLPTLYFMLQGAGIVIERSSFGRAWRLGYGWHGHTFAFVFVVLPIGVLFPPAFVLNVMVPFFQTLHAL